MLLKKYKNLLVIKEDKILTISVNRPKVLNALNKELLSELKALLTLITDTDFKDLRGVILSSEGEKAFIAGADIKEMDALEDDKASEFSSLGQEVSLLFSKVKVPVIACVQGYALGGGCEMAMSADWIYATENAIFGLPELSLGLIPGFGGTKRLAQFVGLAKAKELIFTGSKWSAQEACKNLLVNQVFSSKEEMLAFAKKQLLKVERQSALGVFYSKKTMEEAYFCNMQDSMSIEKKSFSAIFSSKDKRTGIKAFLSKEKPNFQY
ncbi:MAG: enoyl-CoA hydratase/isomerase family protein [Bdellovibrionaceae bacterium]|nr:enoyl-CoA hydratase/isomerase family protein [Pseudobdellovibrionaceae bacterium]